MVDDITYVRDLPLISMLTLGSLKEPFMSQSPAGRQTDRHLLWFTQVPKRRLLVSSPPSFLAFQRESNTASPSRKDSETAPRVSIFEHFQDLGIIKLQRNT